MKKNNLLPITCLVVMVTIGLAGCALPKSTIDSLTTITPNSIQTEAVATNAGAVETTIPAASPTALSPTQPDVPETPPDSTVFLPSVYKDSFTSPYEGAAEPSEQVLPPDRWQEWPVIPEISAHALEIYWAGIAQGNDPQHFSKVGDCQNIHQYFLGLFDDPSTYILGDKYGYLQETIDYYSGNWSRPSEAVRTGFNVASVLTPLQANPQDCQPAETPLACEIRIWKPSFVLISMETWTSDRPVDTYGDYMRQIVDYAISKNVMPIVATKADNLEGGDAINRMVADIAAEYDIPMWNFWAAAHPLTDQGLREDRFHLTNGPNNYTSAESLDLAWPVRNLTGLLMIDAVWKAVK